MTPKEAKEFLTNHLTGWRTFNSTNLALLNSEDRLVRALPDVREHEFYPIARHLQQFADPKNADKSAVVVDPEVDDQKASGTWRHVSCYLVRTDANGRESGAGKHFLLVQELRRGFLTSLPDSEARLVNTSLLPGDKVISPPSGDNFREKVFTLQWNAVDPDAMDTLAEGKLSTAVQTNVKYRRAIVKAGQAANVTIDGANLTLRVIAVQTGMADDGTGVVTVQIGDPEFVLTDWQNDGGAYRTVSTTYYEVPEARIQALVDALEAEAVDGRTVQASRGGNGLGSVTVRDLDYAEKDHAEGVGGWKVWRSIDGDVTYREVKNPTPATIAAVKATLVTQANAGMQTSYSESVDQFGNVTVNAQYRPQRTTIRITSQGWNDLGEDIYVFPSFETANGTKYHGFEVRIKRTSSKATAKTHFETAFDPPKSPPWVWAPEYRGYRGAVTHHGGNRWQSIRIEINPNFPDAP